MYDNQDLNGVGNAEMARQQVWLRGSRCDRLRFKVKFFRHRLEHTLD